MIGFLWLGAGATAWSSILNFALGIHRPLRWERLCYSLLMAVLALYFLVQIGFYSTGDVAHKVEVVRVQMALILLFFTGFAAFICLYADWRPARTAVIAYGLVVFPLFIYNFLSPYTLYFTELPVLNTVNPLGMGEIHMLVAPVHPVMLIFFAWQMTVSLGSAYIIWRECPGKGLMLAGILIGASGLILDFSNDALKAGLPYSAEFCAAVWGLFVSMELVRDVRRLEVRLENAMRAALMMRDQLNTPLQTLTLGLSLIDSPSAEQKTTLERLKRSVARINELGQSLQRESLQGKPLSKSKSSAAP